MRRSGFTLLEVLVALMIFALTAVVLGSSYLNVLNSYEAASRANQHDDDLAFARSRLLAERDRVKAELGTEFDTVDSRHVRWSSTIVAAGLPDLFSVTFLCEITDLSKSGELQKTTQTFTLLRPTWSEPVENSQLKQAAQDRIAEMQGKKK